jgi:predicted Zn-dependent peptidase
MGVWVDVGARDENPEENGLSHFIEHMIFKGTEKRSAYQIAKEFDAIGGQTNAFTTMENTCYHAKVLDSQTKTMVDILSDIFLNSTFEASEVERERPVILQEIGMVEDSPDEYVHYLSGHNYWGDNPLGRSILGRPENVVRFDAETIKSFFQRLYQPERIVIAAAGNIEHQAIVDLIGPSYGAIRAGVGFPERVSPTGRCLVSLNHRKLEQVHICLNSSGIAITDPRRYALSLLNTILGGNMSSRLFQQIREKRGLAYAVYSFVSSHVDTGLFGVYLGVHPDHVHRSVELVLREIGRLKKDRVTPEELKGAVEYTRGSLLLSSESSDHQMVRTAQNELHFGKEIEIEEIIERIAAVTPEDIRRLACDLFKNDLMALTLLGPVAEEEVKLKEILASTG